MTFQRANGRLGGAVRPSPIFLLVVAVVIAGGVLAWTGGGIHDAKARFGVFLLVIGGWIISVCLHEFGHAYAAWRYGDHNVETAGYLTLNPVKYSHPLLSIGMPLLFIAIGGFALPGGAVYVNKAMMSKAQQRNVSLAGPLVNLSCAVVLLVLVRLLGEVNDQGYPVSHEAFWYGLSFLAFLQITATVLNLIPIPGFDGYGALEPSLSPETRRSLEPIRPYGYLLLMALIFIPALNQLFFNVVDNIFSLSGIKSFWSSNGQYLTQFWKSV